MALGLTQRWIGLLTRRQTRQSRMHHRRLPGRLVLFGRGGEPPPLQGHEKHTIPVPFILDEGMFVSVVVSGDPMWRSSAPTSGGATGGVSGSNSARKP